jgi:fucose permease
VGQSTHDRQRAAVSVAFLAFGVVSGSWVPRLPAFKDHLRLTDGQIGFALLMCAVGAIAGAGMARVVLSRGSRAWVRTFTVVLGLALIPAGLATSFAVFVVAFLVLGACAGFIDVLENAQAAEVERVAGRPMLNGFHGFWSLGAVIGSIAAGAAAFLGVPPLEHFVVVALLVTAISALLLRTLPNTRGGADPVQEATTLSLVTRSAVLLVAALGFSAIIVEGGGADWNALYLREYGHASQGLAAVGFAGFSVAMMAVRFRADRLTAATSGAKVARLGAMLAVIGFGIAIALPAVPGAIFGFVLVGTGVAVLVPLAFSAGANLGRSGTALSLVAAAAYAGSIAGPGLIGIVADHLGLRLALGIPLVAALIAAVLAGSLGDRASSQTDRPYSEA